MSNSEYKLCPYIIGGFFSDILIFNHTKVIYILAINARLNPPPPPPTFPRALLTLGSIGWGLLGPEVITRWDYPL